MNKEQLSSYVNICKRFRYVISILNSHFYSYIHTLRSYQYWVGATLKVKNAQRIIEFWSFTFIKPILQLSGINLNVHKLRFKSELWILEKQKRSYIHKTITQKNNENWSLTRVIKDFLSSFVNIRIFSCSGRDKKTANILKR